MVKLIHPDDQSRVAQAFSSALADGPSYNVEYRVILADARFVTIHSYADMTRDDRENQSGCSEQWLTLPNMFSLKMK